MLLKGIDEWNKWRELNPDIIPNLNGANLINADFRYADLHKADLRIAYLSDANLSYANLSYAKLTGADLSYAKLCKAKLTGAKLNIAYLNNADLRSTNLINSDLRGANLLKANLHDAILISTDLEDAKLEGANVSGANIYNIKTPDWKIDRIICTHVYSYPLYANEEEKENSRIEFEEGEFEAKYRTMPTIELVLSGGLQIRDHYKMNYIIKEVSDKYGAELEVTAMKKVFKGMSVILETKSNKYLEEIGRMIVREYKNRDLDSRLLAAIKDEKILGLEANKPEIHHHYHKGVQNIYFGQLLGATVTNPGTGPINIIGEANKSAIAIGTGATATFINNYEANKEEIEETLKEFKELLPEAIQEKAEELNKALKDKKEDEAKYVWKKIKRMINKADKSIKIGEKVIKLPNKALTLYQKLEGWLEAGLGFF